MLRFILGKPACGKTYTVMNKIKELADKNESVVLIVPEQFTFESEREVLKVMGDKAALNVSVLSFSRLYDEIGNICGGIAGRILTDADKIIFMHRALSQTQNELELWGKYSKNLAFASTMLDTIGEFKINAISPEMLRKTAENMPNSTLKSKLSDIALICETYDMLVSERFIDPTDRLTKLYRDLENTHYFKGKTVFFDSFKGFTGQQYRIMERIFAQCDDVYVSLTDNPEIKKEYGIYTNIRTAAEKIRKIASNYKLDEAPPIVLGESRYKSENLSQMERLLASSQNEKTDNNGAITVCFANTQFDETEFAFRTIRKLVRTQGYRYRDFVIISRDADMYEEAVSFAAEKNGVSCFYDKRMPLADLPQTVAAMCAIKAIRFSTENILRFHKTGLGTLTVDEISELENYTYLWNVDGEHWLNNWEMDPRGFVAEEETLENTEKLLRINRLRQKAIAPLLEFKKEFFGNAKNMARAIVNLFENCSISEKLSSMCDKFSRDDMPFSADVLKQGYDMFMDILDSLVTSFSDSKIDAAEFTQALEIAVSKATIGVIPQCLDEVTFGSADRIRPSRPKIAFILGANQGLFPKTTSNSGVFNTIERKNLIENGLEIADNSVYSAIDEEYLVYCNLCCPSEKLYISCFAGSITGEKSEPAAFVDNLLEKLYVDVVYEPQEKLTNENAPETNEAAFSEFCRRLVNSPDDAKSISQAIKDSENYKKTELITALVKGEEKRISPKAAKELYSDTIYMSATKFDTFNRCKFSYFCRYGLRAKKIQPADFDVLQRGTIVHFVLERIITEHGKKIAEKTKEELQSLTDKYINEYLDSVSGFRSISNARTEFLVSRVSRSLKEVVCHLAEEFSQTDFSPVACELKIGFDGIPLEFPFDGGKIKVNGSIDRVDEYSGYIRIVDYKTGSKSFKLPDILFGLNLQMLLYLYAVIRARNLDDSKAAGILYMPSKRDTNGKGMAMNGLLKGDSELVRAMDKQMNGEFVPKLKFNKDGSLSKQNSSFIEEDKFGEIFDYIEKLMSKTGKAVSEGDIAVSPVDGRESNACAYCDFAAVCSVENAQPIKVPDLKTEEIFEAMKGDGADGYKINR